jgi:hypothetical protein
MARETSANTTAVAAKRREQREVRFGGCDLGLHVALQQPRAVPARDEGEAVAVEDRPERRSLPRELVAELDASEAGLPRLGQAGLQRRRRAEFRHVVVRPGERVDPDADGHRHAPCAWRRRCVS